MHKRILVTGILTPLFFWVIVFLGGMINVHYDHLHNTISELGMKGAPAEKFMFIALLLLTILSLVFSLLFFKCCRFFKISVVPALLSFSMPLSILWAAILPMGNYLHDKQGPLPLFLLVGMVAAFFFWPKREFYNERLWSGLAVIVLLLIFLRFVKPFGNEYEGLVQRLYYLGWTIWCISIGILFSKRLKEKKVI
jgi:hypothetical membrane protein